VDLEEREGCTDFSHTLNIEKDIEKRRIDMSKVKADTIKMFSSSIDGFLIKKIFSSYNVDLIVYGVPKDNIYVVNYNDLIVLDLFSGKVVPAKNVNFFVWNRKESKMEKVGLTLKSGETFLLEEEDLVNLFIAQQTDERFAQRSERLLELEEFLKLKEPSKILIYLERYPENRGFAFKKLKKVILKSFIDEIFVDYIVDHNFTSSVVNYDQTMYIYTLGDEEGVEDKIIEAYQDLYSVNTDVILREEEKIVPFESAEFIPHSSIFFLGYKNGIYDPLRFVNLSFRIDFYRKIQLLESYRDHLLEVQTKYIIPKELFKIIKSISSSGLWFL